MTRPMRADRSGVLHEVQSCGKIYTSPRRKACTVNLVLDPMAILSYAEEIGSDDLYAAAKRDRDDYDLSTRRYNEYRALMLSRGLRPEYCIHGSYQWTDSDVNCLDCELGDPEPTLADFFAVRKQQLERMIAWCEKIAREIEQIAGDDEKAFEALLAMAGRRHRVRCSTYNEWLKEVHFENVP